MSEWKPQPEPVKSQSPEVWPLIIEDVARGRYSEIAPLSDAGKHRWDSPAGERLVGLFASRHQYGLKKYGTGLQVWNGRDPLQDLLDEAVDAVAYSRQLYEQNKTDVDWQLHLLAVRFAVAVVERLRRVPE